MDAENQPSEPPRIDLNQLRDDALARKKAGIEEPQPSPVQDTHATTPEPQPLPPAGPLGDPSLEKLREIARARRLGPKPGSDEELPKK